MEIDEAFWIDGEWISWDQIEDEEDRRETELERLEREAELRWKYPNADPQLVEYYEDLVDLAREYHRETKRHLEVYGAIGELHGAVRHGIRLHENPHAQGSDGRLGDDFVEIKTISPLSKNKAKEISLENRHFNKILLVRIDEDFEVKSYLMDRSCLPKGRKSLKLTWDSIRVTD